MPLYAADASSDDLYTQLEGTELHNAVLDNDLASVQSCLANEVDTDAEDSEGDNAPIGEIEDYKVGLAKVGNLVFEDRDFDGVQDATGEPGIDAVANRAECGGACGAV